MEINEKDLFNQLYYDNLVLKAKTKLLLHLIMLIATKEAVELSPSKILEIYNSKIEGYLEDQILASPLKDEHLQSMAEEFLKQVKDELKQKPDVE